ncbi:MAG: DUF4962 domain-containing protein [Armatimonadetes bacterium]|nr:DUF4962 domain-containing protein [Armatimonadota bacterium]
MVSVLVAMACSVVAQPNLLANGGFEEVRDGLPVGWAFENWRMGGVPGVGGGGGRAGGAAASVTCATDQERGAWRQIVPLQGPRYVYFAAWYRTSFAGPPPADGKGAVVRFLFFRDAAKWDHPWIPSFGAPPSEDWAQFSKVLPASKEITSVGIELFSLSAAGTVRWDDVELRPATDEEAAAARREEAARMDRAPEPGETGYAPEDGTVAPLNPPVFVWLPVEQVGEYVLQWSPDPAFPEAATETVRSSLTIHAPRHVFAPGRWHWRFGCERPAPVERVWSRPRSFTVTEDAPRMPFPDVADVVRRLSAYRPRDFLAPGDLERFRALAQGELKPSVDAMRRDAERFIGQDLLPEPPRLPPPGDPNRGAEYTRIFRATRPFNAGMAACAQAYLLTGEERFGLEARRRLMHLMTWDPEGSTSLFHHDEPGTELVRLCPRVYDWIYPLLSEEERRKCCEVLAIRIPQLHKALSDMRFETHPYSSHPMDYYISDLTEACVAMAGDLPVEGMLEYVLTQLWSPFYPPFGGPEGGWCEGPSYWQWSTASFLRTFSLAKLATGCDLTQRPWLRNTPYFKLYCNPPYSKMSPFGDGQSSPAGGGDTMFKLGVVLRDPYALWFAEQQQRKPWGLEELLFRREGLESRAPTDLPQARCFPDIGLAAMHSDLANGARNVHFMLRSSPYGAISHAYADQNAFILHAYGEPLAIASGYYPYYASPHHAQWTWLTKASNSILVDNEGQQARSWLSRGRIAQFATTDYGHYARGDARWAYPGRLKRFDRHALFLRPQSDAEEAVVVIYDDLEAEQPATYQWLLHALDEMQIDEAAATVTVSRGQAHLQARFLTPSGLAFSQTDQFTVPPEAPNMPNQWHLTASTRGPAARQRFLTVLLPYPAGVQPADVRLLDVPGCLAAEIAGTGLTHTVLFRTEAPSRAPVSLAGTQTDADVFALARSADGTTKAVFSARWEAQRP